MNFKKIMPLLVLAIIVFSMTFVSAADNTNQTDTINKAIDETVAFESASDSDVVSAEESDILSADKQLTGGTMRDVKNALNQANSGDTIYLNGGTYIKDTGSNPFGGFEIIKDNVTVMGGKVTNMQHLML